jgi:cytochrome b561
MDSHTPSRYSAAQKWLHWGMAVLIATLAAVGLVMTRLGEGQVTGILYELHKSVGLVVLALAIVRIGVRVARGVPAPEHGIPAWQRLAGRASHYALYALVVLVPLAGWTATSSCCGPVKLFWTVPLTVPVPGEEAFSKAVFWIHFALAVTLIGVILVHVAGALQHHLFRRDGTLIRMLPDSARWRSLSRRRASPRPRRAHPTLGHMLVTDLKISEAARQDIAIELRVRPGARHRADIDDELNLHRA